VETVRFLVNFPLAAPLPESPLRYALQRRECLGGLYGNPNTKGSASDQPEAFCGNISSSWRSRFSSQLFTQEGYWPRHRSPNEKKLLLRLVQRYGGVDPLQVGSHLLDVLVADIAGGAASIACIIPHRPSVQNRYTSLSMIFGS